MQGFEKKLIKKMRVALQNKECLNKKKLKLVYRSICRLKISQNQSENYRKMNLALTKCRHKKTPLFHYFCLITCIYQKKVVPLHAICARTRARYYV